MYKGIQREYKKQDRTNWISDKEYHRTHKYKMFGKQPFHVALWEEYYGPVPPDCCIHHINLNHLDNRIENLLCVTTEEHRRYHSGNYIKTLFGWLKRCTKCRRYLPIDSEVYFSKTQNGSGRDQVRHQCKECRARKMR
jgi:hypothetical protein